MRNAEDLILKMWEKEDLILTLLTVDAFICYNDDNRKLKVFLSRYHIITMNLGRAS